MPYEGIDGRTLTDYRPNCEMNRLFMSQRGITNNFQGRMYYQRNAVEIMNQQRKIARERNRLNCNCPQCYHISNK